jgi:VIT1/CCC1 family predicted Fe2+/Mn2+ transporter
MRDRNWLYAIGGGAVIGGLAWLDPIFIPLVLLGPLVTGSVAGRRGTALRYLVAAWAIGGMSMLVSDWIANHEDKAFHAALTLVMVALASAGWFVARATARRRAAVA